MLLSQYYICRNLTEVRRVGIALIVAGLIVGCGTEEPELSKEKVIFNTAIITLVPDGGQKTIELIYKDLDLDGNAEVVSQAVLKPNTSYSASLKLLNEVGGTIDDVTNEILLNFPA